MAIRSTKNTSLLQMKMAIAAVLHHCTQKEDEDKDDRHKYCPSDGDTWCKYQRRKIEGVEFKGDRVNISEHIYQLIRPLWLRLSDNVKMSTWSNTKYLHGRTQNVYMVEHKMSTWSNTKCLHGRTQNVNEAFNAYGWKRAPKDIFVSKKVLDMSVASAVVAFNDGPSGALEIMKKVGLSAGYYNMEASRNADLVRISGVAYKETEIVKIQRKKLHAFTFCPSTVPKNI